MSVLRANCPSCAAPIEFKSGSSVVIVCPYCHSAVTRKDRKLEDLGRVPDIVQSRSPLFLGIRGEYQGHPFEVTGRAQIGHDAGGNWDEWYATFSNGWVGWLAEAQGKFYLTFHKPLDNATELPKFELLEVGSEISGISGDGKMFVAEKGFATQKAAEGEIPYLLTPGEKHPYADLVGKGNTFATIDYSHEEPFIFYGNEVSLADIGLAEREEAKREAPEVNVGGMSCPNCGGSLELKAPDKTERVTCPYCVSLLDVNQGDLKFLHTLVPSPESKEFLIPIGTKCNFKKFCSGNELEVIGSMTRSVRIEGQKYYWHEYLLYNPKIGFRWLTQSDDNWSFVEPLNRSEIEYENTGIGIGKSPKFKERRFKRFQDAPARVEYVQGEFYWRVEVGEKVSASDFIAPPLMITREATKSEENWSLSTYISPKDVAVATGVKGLPTPRIVAPNQPNSYKSFFGYSLAMVAIYIIIGILFIPISAFRAGNSTVKMSEEYTLRSESATVGTKTFESQEFDLDAQQNVDIEVGTKLNNSWAEFDVDLVRSSTEYVETVSIPLEYYSGVTDGEAWSEGSGISNATISAVPAGKYKLRILASWKDYRKPINVRIKVEQNVIRGVNFFVGLFVLLIVPVITFFQMAGIEQKRWEQSMYSSSGTG